MSNKLRLFYLITSLISLTFITLSILNIKYIINQYYEMKQKLSEEQIINCKSYFVWKTSLFINLFFFFASLSFLVYLTYKRNSNYDRVIFIRVGPTVDMVILIFLMVISFIFGPVMIVEVFLMMFYYEEIMHDCKNIITERDYIRNLFVAYFIICFFLSLFMNGLMFVVCTRRIYRGRRIQRRNITFIGEFMETIQN